MNQNVNNKIIIKKYPNRRLYDTSNSTYVTLEDLTKLIEQEYEIKVIDVKSSEDITKITLIQIVLEQQNKGHDLLPLELLKQIIKFQNHAYNSVLIEYMNLSIEYFIKNNICIKNLIGTISTNIIPIELWGNGLKAFNHQNIDFMRILLTAVDKCYYVNNEFKVNSTGEKKNIDNNYDDKK